MGDIADAMLEGDLCQSCGVYMEGNGYPQTCPACLKDSGLRAGRSGVGKVSCKVCGRRVKEAGIKDHMRDKHSAQREVAK